MYLFGAALSSFLVAFSNSLVGLGLFIGMVGTFCSTYHPASSTLISRGMRKQGKGFGIHGISGSLGVPESLLDWRLSHYKRYQKRTQRIR